VRVGIFGFLVSGGGSIGVLLGGAELWARYCVGRDGSFRVRSVVARGCASAATAAPAIRRGHEVSESWQLIEPSGVRMMHGPAGIRLLEYLPATRRVARVARFLRLTPLATAVNRLLSRIRKPLGRFFPNPRLPRRWP